jgi:hypothetical protein
MPTARDSVARAASQRKAFGLAGVSAMHTASGRIVVRYPAKGLGWSKWPKARSAPCSAKAPGPLSVMNCTAPYAASAAPATNIAPMTTRAAFGSRTRSHTISNASSSSSHLSDSLMADALSPA